MRSVTLRAVRTFAAEKFGAAAVVQECFGPHEYVVLVDGRIAIRKPTLMLLYEALSHFRTAA